MTPTQLHICPQCGCPDLYGDETKIILDAKDKELKCPNCGWQGALADSAAIVTTENVYDIQAVANLLIHVVTRQAAGPLSQALIIIGLLDRDDQQGIDKVLRATLGAMVEAAFTAAAERAQERIQEQANGHVAQTQEPQ